MRSLNRVCRLASVAAAVFCGQTAHGQVLEAELLASGPKALVEQARASGDAARGAIVFHQRQLACSRCHIAGNTKEAIGPDLASRDQVATDEELVEAILLPSKKIRRGYETIQISTRAGELKSGRLLERNADRVVLRDATTSAAVSLPAAEIEEIIESKVSLMPAGQANLLASRQQFLDLVRYLIEIRDGGPDRARSLQPSPALLAFSIPEYEARVDHAGLILAWDAKSLERGAAIYQRVCANCHGTLDQPGSLPTSLRFAEGKFKNGHDPYAMYHTLTHGFGMMTPQPWMVPVQKYDVVHYIRETFLRDRNPSQYASIEPGYLDRLPKGDTFGPEPSKIQPWSAMDYGSQLTHTYEVPGSKLNIAYKGIAARLDPGAGGIARGSQWMLFDADTMRWAAGWEYDGGENRFIDWKGIQFNGQHQVHPRISGKTVFANSTGPGWAQPGTLSFEDQGRVVGRDGRLYGPLPRDWAKFRGLYHFGPAVVVTYDIGETSVAEMPAMLPEIAGDTGPVFLRKLWIGPRRSDMLMRVADAAGGAARLRYHVWGGAEATAWSIQDNELRLRISAGEQPLELVVGVAEDRKKQQPGSEARFIQGLDSVSPAPTCGPTDWKGGGQRQWETVLESPWTRGDDSGSFAVDELILPASNPWLAQVRLTGLDFLPDGRLAVCTWDGDVWLVECPTGPAAAGGRLKWKRIASGMFQPLGLKVVEGTIFVACRDQIARLVDLNGDEAIDYYECFNGDHQVTEHFHEFAMGLQRDAEGNFYYAKSARHALKAVVPHHGTLLKVSPDGKRTEIIAEGFRAANGVCLNPDGTFFVTDQEGHWTPKNRINWVKPGIGGHPRFYGNLFGYTDVVETSDSAMEQPVCWITNAFERSPGELLRVDSRSWGPLNESLLCLSYGYGRAYLVLHERAGESMQGGMIALPIPSFPTGIMRGRFHQEDGHLYACGMYAWAGNAQAPGGLYRIRATGRPIQLPKELHVSPQGISLQFTSSLDQESVRPEKVSVKTWSLRRTAQYGSKHFDERTMTVESATVDSTGTRVTLTLPGIAPTWCMEIEYHFRAIDGTQVDGVIHNSIQTVAP